MSGTTLYFCIGRYAGWHVIKDGDSIRVIMGWLSIAILFFDLEVFLGAVVNAFDEDKGLQE